MPDEEILFALELAHRYMDDQNARGMEAQCYWCGSKGYDGDGLTHLDTCPIRVLRRAIAKLKTHA